MAAIRANWPEIERYLIEMHRHIHTYAEEPFEMVAGRVKARVAGDPQGG